MHRIGRSLLDHVWEFPRDSRRSVVRVARGISSISPVLMRTANRTNARRPHKKESDVSEKNDPFVGAARSRVHARARSRMYYVQMHARVCACMYMYTDESTYRDGICRPPRCTSAVPGRDHPGRFSGWCWTCTAAFSDRPRPPSATVSANTSFRRSAHIEIKIDKKTLYLFQSSATDRNIIGKIAEIVSLGDRKRHTSISTKKLFESLYRKKIKQFFYNIAWRVVKISCKKIKSRIVMRNNYYTDFLVRLLISSRKKKLKQKSQYPAIFWSNGVSLKIPAWVNYTDKRRKRRNS